MQLEIPFRTKEMLVKLEDAVEHEIQEHYREEDFLPEYKPTYKSEYVDWLNTYCEHQEKEKKNFKKMSIRQLAAIYISINKKAKKERVQAETFLQHHHSMNREETPSDSYTMTNQQLLTEVEKIRKTYN